MNLIEASERCLLALTPQNQLVCATLTTRQVLGVWPYNSLRRYWCKSSTFGFEAGRRSPRGEGLFTFGTDRDEELYRTLEKCIKRAKKGSISRPPAPLPNSLNSSDTPPVSTSESDDDEPPLAVPSRTPTTSRAQTVRRSPNDSEGPGPSPANLRRMKTHTGLVAEHKWLHKSVNPQPSKDVCNPSTNVQNGEGPEDTYSHTVHKPLPKPLPTGRNDNEPEDLYSHTVHKLPPPFVPREQPNGSTYQRLHSQPSVLPAGAGYSDLPEEDMRVYDVAFQPGTHATVIPSDSQYTTLGQPDPVSTNLVPSTQSSAATPSSYNEDGLMDNPLYASQENLLCDPQTEMLRAALANFEEQAKEMSDPSLNIVLETSMDSIDAGGVKLDDSRPEKLFPLNPNYVTHSLHPVQDPVDNGRGSHCTDDNQEIPEVDRTVESNPPAQLDVVNGESEKHGGESEKHGRESEKHGGKGYSKVDKSKKAKQDDTETPPPIPERCYSYDGFDITTDS